ncbi:AP-4 complex subunit epsilon [Amphibalanus amphitrite]|uniref:AP-4 complex subunit epsilon n=1 Tax=Amphibalanus amphitrite TaxID=1232801 RepID=A0A6A4X768_AMPAM|nr:AP-4 complex subunit epsilon [Amphibalanus amphitrite]KAF0313289.1 AP-4 complex subunit epsilon [Amphibalanus amphitrite]
MPTRDRPYEKALSFVHNTKLISYLCPADSGLSETFSQFLVSQLTAPVPATVMGFAILCECVSAAATLPPPPAPPDPAGGDGSAPADGLHAAALRCTALMLRSANGNVRYAGLSALCRLCEAGGARPAGPLQLAVVQCLRDEDETVRLRALQLLHAVATEQSAAAVCQRLLEAVAAAERRPLRTLLLGRAALLAERYLTRRPQLLHVINRVLEEDEAPAARLRSRLAAEPPGGPLRPAAARLYAELVVGGGAAPAVQRMALWVVGETGHLLEPELLTAAVGAVCDRLPQLAADDPLRDRQPGESSSPLQQHLHALNRLVWECRAELPAAAAARLADTLPPLAAGPDPAAAQLARCTLALLGDAERLRRAAVLAEDVLSGRARADFTLSFADARVAAELERGAAVLRPPPVAAAGPARLGASVPTVSDRSSPSLDAGSPFETLGTLPLPRFLSVDEGDASVDEPPPVWTLKGRAPGPVSSPAAPDLAPPPAAHPAPSAEDETAREVAALFPSDDS